MKSCNTCKQEKELEEYALNKTRKDGRANVCKACRIVYHAQHYKLNKQAYYDNKNERRKVSQRFLYDFYKSNPCIVCGYAWVAALQLHHKWDKFKNVSKMVFEWYTIETLKKEIAKCDVLCANCHAEQTAIEANRYKDVR